MRKQSELTGQQQVQAAVRALQDGVRCSAKSKRSGVQCNNARMLGQTVCRMHGGATQASRAKGRERLLEAVDPLYAELVRLALNPAKDDAVKLAAIRDALDRAGETAQQDIKVKVESAWDALIEGVIAEVPDDHEAVRLSDRVIDGEHVPPPDRSRAMRQADTDEEPPVTTASDRAVDRRRREGARSRANGEVALPQLGGPTPSTYPGAAQAAPEPTQTAPQPTGQATAVRQASFGSGRRMGPSEHDAALPMRPRHPDDPPRHGHR